MKSNWIQKLKDNSLTIDDFEYHWVISKTSDNKFTPVYFTSLFEEIMNMNEVDKAYLFQPNIFNRISNITSKYIEKYQDYSGKLFDSKEEAIKYLRDNKLGYDESKDNYLN